jgi:hypothetical protein
VSAADAGGLGHDLSRIIEHRSFVAARDEVISRIREHDGLEPLILPVLGPTRVGKTELLNAVKAEVDEPTVGPRSTVATPSFGVSDVPAKPNARTLLQAMAAACGFRASRRDETDQLAERLKTWIEDFHVVGIALDEFTHCQNSQSNFDQKDAADYLKMIADRTRIAIVIAGLPSLQDMIDKSSQLQARCAESVMVLPYDWRDEDHRDAFYEACLYGFEVLNRHGVTLSLDEPEAVVRLYGASAGRVGLMLRLLRETAKRVRAERSLGLEELAAAASRSFRRQVVDRSFFDGPEPDEERLVRSYAEFCRTSGVAFDVQSVRDIDLGTA